MYRGPFQHKPAGAWGESAVQRRQAVDLYENLMFSVKRVKVWWTMVANVHTYNDTVETA